MSENTTLTTVHQVLADSWNEEPGQCGETPLYCLQCTAGMVASTARDLGMDREEILEIFISTGPAHFSWTAEEIQSEWARRG